MIQPHFHLLVLMALTVLIPTVVGGADGTLIWLELLMVLRIGVAKGSCVMALPWQCHGRDSQRERERTSPRWLAGSCLFLVYKQRSLPSDS